MPDWEVRWRPAAEQDLQRCAIHIAQDNIEAALGLVDAAEAEAERLADHPFAHEEIPVLRPELRGIRRLVLSPPYQNFLLFYRADSQVVDVIRVLHGARDLPRSIWEPDDEPG